MKVYVITCLIESQDEGAEVNLVGIEKTKQNAYLLMINLLREAKSMYEENDFDYEVEQYGDETIIISTDMERIEYNMFESEV